MTILKAHFLTLFILINTISSISSANTSDDDAVIFSKTVKIIFVNDNGKLDENVLEDHPVIKLANECARYDKENIYSAYMLESTHISATLSDKRSPLTNWFDSKYYGDREVTEVIHQTCRGVGLKADIIEAN